MKLNLSVRKIVDKEFKKKHVGGYDPQEVDNFLDLIIEDYETIAQYIQKEKEEMQRLRDENYQLKKDMMNNTGNLTKEDTLELQTETTAEPPASIVEEVVETKIDVEESRRLDDLERKMDRMEKILLHLEEKL